MGTGHVSATGIVTGAVVGLVLITPAAGYVIPLTSVLIGAFGCPIAYASFSAFSKIAYDDSLNVFPCHGVPALLGAVFTGVFANKEAGGLFYTGDFALVGKEIACSLAIATYASVMTTIILFVQSRVMNMRVEQDHELGHLDSILHNEIAYGASVLNAVAEDAGSEDSSDDEERANLSGNEGQHNPKRVSSNGSAQDTRYHYRFFTV